MANVNEKLGTQSAAKSFFQYFIPTLIGMMLMSVNIVIDGIFVGNGIGSTALASVNIAVPVFSIIISIALLIGLGGGTLYSMAMGEGNEQRAKHIFTLSILLVFLITITTTGISILNIERLALLFGANAETLPYVLDYMTVLLFSGLIFALEVVVSIFIRNDGAPKLAMIGLVATAVINIGLNYWMIFILHLEVTGAALATTIATGIGLLIYTIHFFKKDSGLKLVRLTWDQQSMTSILKIGFPGFLSEAGMGVFVMGYNVALAYHVGTNGLAAFSVINYLHVFMFLAFLSIGSTIQPMISYYYGAKAIDKIKTTIRLSEATALALGLLFIAIGYLGADMLVDIFGVANEDIANLATTGIKLFFVGYLFMGINFIYMTYYQSIGSTTPANWITLSRGFLLLIIMLLVLPFLFGINGIWLSLPAAEGIVAILLIVFARKNIMQRNTLSRQL
ncbi:MATE family efflux transporter [Lentibacillus saliphilus]|uniref:MATE family efflux transporter n=1 Tax=Lentibacillus saliphilus TaxID=2737028 RepID=UPI001C303238|nr:MATE family efflux transporter [Lentibacillus saliphilus]